MRFYEFAVARVYLFIGYMFLTLSNWFESMQFKKRLLRMVMNITHFIVSFLVLLGIAFGMIIIVPNSCDNSRKDGKKNHIEEVINEETDTISSTISIDDITQ